jgi:hypothetical protein
MLDDAMALEADTGGPQAGEGDSERALTSSPGPIGPKRDRWLRPGVGRGRHGGPDMIGT